MTAWLSKAIILAIHDEQLAEHGGRTGVRDDGLRESAFRRTGWRTMKQRISRPWPPLTRLAARAIISFIDGNKRTAFVAAELFLGLNGMTLAASDQDCVLTMLRLAAGEIEEEGFAAWLRANAH
ncbi:type II toxin-antitoxin system death-on-curing family toxin [Dongia deserti]|uniref:type II toxin-antitoxin system death-on-curing family toxin n=1 Tax=Dongia deserti TaxID=2268030 RepID=UPI0025472106|nr:Fic family protein [Dongia deserti]